MKKEEITTTEEKKTTKIKVEWPVNTKYYTYKNPTCEYFSGDCYYCPECPACNYFPYPW